MYPFMPYNWYLYSGNMYSPLNMQPYYQDNQNYDMYTFSENLSVSQGDPPPILSDRPAATALVLRKELTGYQNYGNPSGNADILYTGNSGTWTFDIPAFLSGAINRFSRVELILRGALDDHYDVNQNRYSMNVRFNNSQVFSGRPPFVHGRPGGQQFNNWNQLTIRIPSNQVRRNNRVVIRNTSNAGPNDFIALDWMEMRFYL